MVFFGNLQFSIISQHIGRERSSESCSVAENEVFVRRVVDGVVGGVRAFGGQGYDAEEHRVR